MVSAVDFLNPFKAQLDEAIAAGDPVFLRDLLALVNIENDRLAAATRSAERAAAEQAASQSKE